MRTLPLNVLTSPHATLVEMHGIDYKVFHITRPHVLVQAAGYLKHVRASSSAKSVYFRGQRSLYKTIPPTLYRGLKKSESRVKRDDEMNRLLKKIRAEQKIFRAVPDHVQEPLLQHYGLKTRWLDVVDNVWIALWFACHSAHTFGSHSQYQHFERRIPRHLKDNERFAYIILLESSSIPSGALGPGCFQDISSVTIDLRVAAPSHFVRPHAQHGLVVKALDDKNRAPLDFSPLLAGVIRVDLEDALEWLGAGDLLNVHALFPPPPYDCGYQEILNNLPDPNGLLGAIHHIGTGK
jgi:hypothetical protein